MYEINSFTGLPENGGNEAGSKRKSVDTIYYFHGYNGYLTQEKNKVLQQFGKVIAPTFNYGAMSTLPEIIASFNNVDLESAVFMGTSFGGYVINVLNKTHDIPGLLFNPALPYRVLMEPGREHTFETNLQSMLWFVLGEKDKLVRCQDNLEYISKYIKGPKKVIVNEDLGHSIPVREFEMYASNFLESLV